MRNLVGAFANPNASARFADTISTVERVLAIHAPCTTLVTQPPSILCPAKRAKTVVFDHSSANDGSIVTIGSALDPKSSIDTDVSHFYDLPSSA
jgi:hypothetical protein